MYPSRPLASSAMMVLGIALLDDDRFGKEIVMDSPGSPFRVVPGHGDARGGGVIATAAAPASSPEQGETA